MTAPGNPESQVPEKPVSVPDSLGKEPRPATAHVRQNEVFQYSTIPNQAGWWILVRELNPGLQPIL